MAQVDPNISTPYSTVIPLISDFQLWVPEEDRERIAAYMQYEDMYWNNPNAYKLTVRGSDDTPPIYIPSARTVVDTTAHYYMKGLVMALEGVDEDSGDKAALALKKFLKREKFYSRFHVAKHSGVTRGDFILHLTADPTLPEGSRLSLTSVDPAAYFPQFDDDDLDKKVAVNLVEQVYNDERKRYDVRKLRYEYRVIGGTRRVFRSEAIYEADGWNSEGPKLVRQILPLTMLPPEIDVIPVYHFKNIGWQGWEFGASEIKGFERIMSGINQAVTDEEMALALEGLGVYATDGGRPVDDEGNEVDWVIAPAKVAEVPAGSYFKRVEGVGSVTPMQDHIKYLDQALYEASGTFRAGNIDASIAQSGIALAIRFIPQLAKIEEREMDGVDILSNLFYDWKKWMSFYEGITFPEEKDIVPILGDKLPQDRVAKLNELNNMYDRKIISAEFYRQEMRKLGYPIPLDEDKKILDEIKTMQDATTPPELLDEKGENVGRGNGADGAQGGRPPNQSNNKNRPNESAGTEAE